MPHEICLRAREGLPFPCLATVKVLIESAMARAARGNRISICHFLWMANHLHLIAVVRDAVDFMRFYAELEKRLTDYQKRLLGLPHLQLWESRPMVACILDPESLMRRIEYFYSNPVAANLVTSIDHYPGVSSWQDFKGANSLASQQKTMIPRIRVDRVPYIGGRKLTLGEDKRIAEALLSSATESDCLSLEPNAWMKCFDLQEKDVCGINTQIRENIKSNERQAQRVRQEKQISVRGTQALRTECLVRKHCPKKKERNIFVLSSLRDLRVHFIKEMKALSYYCRELYSKGHFHLWPPGMFRPPLGPIASAISL